MSDEDSGVKIIEIMATTRYPVVSAYEYEFLKVEEVIRERMKACTIYFILQRPLTYFNNLRVGSNAIKFDIVDGDSPPLSCFLPFVPDRITGLVEASFIDVLYYKKLPDQEEPFNNVAAIKIFRENGDFLVWYSPQKFLYEVLVGNLQASIKGDITSFLEYNVHYIGKAFSQPVWDRLTGHHKMQKILTMEDTLSSGETRAPFEISLLMLDITGFSETNMFPFYDFTLGPDVKPIIYRFGYDDNDDRFEKYYEPKLGLNAPELTAEVEAMLVNTFRPIYNEIKFDNYPEIANGTRSAGYTQSRLIIERLPLRLKTSHHFQDAIGLPKGE